MTWRWCGCEQEDGGVFEQRSFACGREIGTQNADYEVTQCHDTYMCRLRHSHNFTWKYVYQVIRIIPGNVILALYTRMTTIVVMATIE